MNEKFQNNILKTISFVPGLVGLASLDPNKKNTALSQKDLIKGISFEETKEGLYIRVGAIIDVDIKAKIVAKELTSAIRQVSNEYNEKLKKVIVYIKGVR